MLDASDTECAEVMGVTVEIERPELLPDLVSSLAASGCMTSAVDERVCRVVHIGAHDAAEELQELRFFLRAWQVRHDVTVTLRPESSTGAAAAPIVYGAAARSNGFSINPCS
jgi:hypothetical protein